LKELQPRKEKVLPANITIAWGRSSVSFGEITYRTEPNGRVRLGRIEHSQDRQFSDDEWQSMLGECLLEARKHPDWQFHFVRLDHADFVPENSNNQPFSADNNWTKHMSMFGWCYERNYEGDNDGTR